MMAEFGFKCKPRRRLGGSIGDPGDRPAWCDLHPFPPRARPIAGGPGELLSGTGSLAMAGAPQRGPRSGLSGTLKGLLGAADRCGGNLEAPAAKKVAITSAKAFAGLFFQLPSRSFAAPPRSPAALPRPRLHSQTGAAEPRGLEHRFLLLVSSRLPSAAVAAAIELDSCHRLVILPRHQQEVDMHLGIPVVLALVGVGGILQEVVQADLWKDHQVKLSHDRQELGKEVIFGPAKEVGLPIHAESWQSVAVGRRGSLGIRALDQTAAGQFSTTRPAMARTMMNPMTTSVEPTDPPCSTSRTARRASRESRFLP